MSGDKTAFIPLMRRVYAIYTGGFIGFVILLAILEQFGLPDRIIGWSFVAFTLLIYAGIGVISRTMDVSEYYVAGRSIPPVFNGMATAADWMSGASFLAMAGTLYALGYDGLAFVVGWTGGYVLVAVLIAPYLRKFGAYTVPDFLAARFGGNMVRVFGIIVLVSASFIYIVAQIRGTGLIAERFLGIPYEIAVFIGLMGILVCSLLGGMRAVTWTQIAQYIVLIIAYMLPVVILSVQQTGIPIPQWTYGSVLQNITVLEDQMLANGYAVAGELKRHMEPFSSYTPLNYFGLIFCLMIGTASLPHVLMRYFTTPSIRDARRSVGWSLLFIFLLYFTAPAYAAFVKQEIYQNVIGQNLANLPEWIYIWGEFGRVKICGVAATSLEAITQACQTDFVRLSDFAITRDVVVIATPEIAGLPYVIAGLVGAGGLAAALSTADGLLLAIANALSHDVYYRMINPHAETRRRLIVARMLLLMVAVVAAFSATMLPPNILTLVAWAFSLAAAGNFPALVLGIWWKRCNREGAIAGMAAGFLVTLFYLVATQYGGMPKWFGVNNISAGLFGIPVGFIVMIVVSKMTPAPSAEIMQLVDDIRVPGSIKGVSRGIGKESPAS